MIRFKIDQESTEFIDSVKQMYNFNSDGIAIRIALSLSLIHNNKFENKEDNLPRNGREYTQTNNTFGKIVNGVDNYIIYKVILNQHYKKELFENEFIKLFKLHLVDGINIWKKGLENSNITKGDHISFLIEPIKRGLAKRSKNVYIKNNNIEEQQIKGTLKPINLILGKDQEQNDVVLKINDESEYTSRHFAISGMNGSGKSQLVLDLLYQISKESNNELNFTFFDFKGTDTKEKLDDFLKFTNADFIKITHEKGFPFSPLKNYDLNNQNYIESFASDLRTFFKDIRQVQSANIVRQIIDFYFDNKKSPTLQELLENLLENNNGKFDTTTSVLQQLINSGIYDEDSSIDIFKNSNYISMPSVVTKEIKQFVSFNLLKYMYNTIKKNGDSSVNNQIKELRHVIVIDEAQNFMQHKNARPVIEEMLRELRSMGVVIILIAQETQDFIYNDFNFMSQIKFPICCDVQDKSIRRIIPFIGSVNSEVRLNNLLTKLESGKGLINIGEPKIIELRQWWKTKSSLK
jgi:DNA sulfur modification protein DndE